MPERAVLILLSLILVVGLLGAVVWLMISGQGLTLDGLFLALSCLTVALVFSIYVLMEVKRAQAKAREQSKPAAAPAAAVKKATAAADKPVPAARAEG
jgi:hypothetical protein